VTADRFSTIPPAWSSVTTQRWLFRLPDPYDYVQAGLTRKEALAAVAAETGLPKRDVYDAVVAAKAREVPRP